MLKNRYGGVDSYAVKHVSFKARVLLRTPHFNKDDLEDISQELVKEEQQQSHDVDNGSPMAQESDSSLNVHHEGAGHADQSSHIEAQKKDTHKETEMPAKQQPKKIKTTFTQRMYGWLQSAGSTIGSLARAIIGDTAVDYIIESLLFV